MKTRYRILSRIWSLTVAALFTAGVSGCAAPALEEEAVQYDEQGRRLVSFRIPTKGYYAALGRGNVRALSRENAELAWDYVQVVLNYKGLDGSGDPDTVWGDTNDEYFVSYADKGDEISFSIPEGVYRGLMFLGVARELRLLALGPATAIQNASGGSAGTVAADGEFTIDANVRTIVFTVDALVSDITNGAFALTGPTGYETDETDKEYTPKPSVSGVASVSYPYFTVPSNVAKGTYGDADVIHGTFSFSGLPELIAPDVEVDLDDSEWLGLADSVVGLTKSIQTIGLAAHNSKTKLDLPPIKVEGEVDSATLKEGALTLGFVLGTPAKDGFVKAQFNAAVKAFGNGAAPGAGNDERGHAWRIENGFNAGLLDAGGDSMGQNVLLLVGDLTAGDYVDIIGSGEWGPPPPVLYVGTGGLDTNDGLSEATKLLTLTAAYTAAAASESAATIVVLSDLRVTTTAIIFDAAQTETITVKGKDGEPKPTLRRSTNRGGTEGYEDEAVIKITSGAKVEFQNIRINGIYSDAAYNRGLFIDGAGTEVTIGNGAAVTGKTSVATTGYSGGGVKMLAGALTLKDGGAISDSVAASRAGGVYASGGTLTMTGGEISGNTSSSYGGGCYLNGAQFNMSGGAISGNTAASYAGGCYFANGTFNMSGGAISGNTATYGAGAYLYTAGIFNMSDGMINGNTNTSTAAHGSGVNLGVASAVFTMTGGVIYGSGEIGTLRNSITTESTTAGGKAAVYASTGTFTINGMLSTGTDDTIDLR
jgi:hypothetical protein